MGQGQVIAFWIFATVVVGAALMVVFLHNIFRAALFLMLCFFTIAGIFVVLSADFLAAVQVLVYVGAIGILLIFGIMLTRQVQQANTSSRWRGAAFLVSGLLMSTIIVVVVNTAWPKAKEVPAAPTTADLAHKLFSLNNGFVLPFEISSLVLLAALLGAIALVRDK